MNNREIKFRAWDKEDKIWRTDVLLAPNGLLYQTHEAPQKEDDVGHYEEVDYTDWYGINHMEVVFFTGLKDKNGVEIYENDIIKDKYGEIYKVGWSSFEIYTGSERNIVVYGWNVNTQEEVEILGNIFENKDLIE